MTKRISVGILCLLLSGLAAFSTEKEEIEITRPIRVVRPNVQEEPWTEEEMRQQQEKLMNAELFCNFLTACHAPPPLPAPNLDPRNETD